MPGLPLRARAALLAARSAAWASQRAGRGKGSMIGGLVALKIEPNLMSRLAAGKRTVVVTGTNGKSTTTRMTAAALGARIPFETFDGAQDLDIEPGTQSGTPMRCSVTTRTP